MSCTLITLSNTTFLIFSKHINLWLRHNLATLRIRKMNVIFNQWEERNSLSCVSHHLFVTCHKLVFCTFSRWNDSLCLVFISWVGHEQEWRYEHEKRGLNTSLKRHANLLHVPVTICGVSSLDLCICIDEDWNPGNNVKSWSFNSLSKYLRIWHTCPVIIICMRIWPMLRKISLANHWKGSDDTRGPCVHPRGFAYCDDDGERAFVVVFGLLLPPFCDMPQTGFLHIQ